MSCSVQKKTGSKDFISKTLFPLELFHLKFSFTKTPSKELSLDHFIQISCMRFSIIQIFFLEFCQKNHFLLIKMHNKWISLSRIFCRSKNYSKTFDKLIFKLRLSENSLKLNSFWNFPLRIFTQTYLSQLRKNSSISQINSNTQTQKFCGALEIH